MRQDSEKISRRDFLHQTGTGATVLGLGLTTGILPVHADNTAHPRRVAQNERVTMALIGCGGMGVSNMNTLMGKPGVDFAAMCDVDENQMAKQANRLEQKSGKRPDTYKDFRKLLQRKDIDAVVIATPDHWHALPLIAACEAGKDAYCEKPISHDITEAKAMDAAVRRYNRIVQVGTWQRSRPVFVSAVAFIRAGKLGPITTVRAWKTDDAKVGHNTVSTPPASLDYDFWLGPAAYQEYRYMKNEVHFNWRWYLNFGSGMTGDWGVHMMDIGLLAMSKDTDLVMPTQVASYGGKWAFPDDERTSPDTVVSLMRFQDPDFVMHWETIRNHEDRPEHGTEFIAADGRSLMVWRGGWTVRDREGKELPREEAPATNDHWQNWLDCLKSRQQPRANLASVAQTTIVCHLVNAALQANETVHWDKAKNDIVSRAGRDTQSFYREYRRPWRLPSYRA